MIRRKARGSIPETAAARRARYLRQPIRFAMDTKNVFERVGRKEAAVIAGMAARSLSEEQWKLFEKRLAALGVDLGGSS
ncbi:hypothetical protein [Pseudoclavibacter helvolus]|uniref:hypothetical protein n=1 Tax=Pseudoclavibacter helvolus TaxID=255205 RepID=UPI00373704FB